MNEHPSDRLSRSQLTSVLNPHLQSVLKIEAEHELVEMRPGDLLSPMRLDVMAKYVYARLRRTGVPDGWGAHVYGEHLRVWNGFKEGDQSGKTTFADFRRSFDALLDIFAATGFDDRRSVLPVGIGNVLIDGSHRLAAALLHDSPVKTAQFEMKPAVYDDTFFRKRGLDEDILDDLVLNYCRLEPRVRIAVLFPVARSRDEDVLDRIREAGTLLYRKTVFIEQGGRANLIRLLYRNEPWLGPASAVTTGLLQHVNNRFAGHEPVKFVFFVSTDDAATRAVKERIRSLFSLGNDSIHINDTFEQTLSVAECVLNRNSLHFLNYARPRAFRNFTKLFREMRQWMAEEGLDTANFCIDGSAVLSAYGLRDANDLDYLYSGSPVPLPPHGGISCHNTEAAHHSHAVETLVTDPRHHFYFEGVKFLSIERLREMKSRRGEVKDAGDVARIDSLAGGSSIPAKLRTWYRTLPERVQTRKFQAMRSLKKSIPSPLKPVARSIYKLPRRLMDSMGPDEKVAVYRGFQLHYSKGTSIVEEISGGRTYEPEVTGQLVRALQSRRSPLCLDIGSNIGIMTLNLLADVPGIRIVAFEPGPHQAGLLEKTLAANNLTHAVTLVRSALSYEAGSARFSVHRSRHASGDGFYDTQRAGRTSTIEVPVTTLDSWWEHAGRPAIDAIKIDTEGAELWVLRGGLSMLDASRPVVVFELHPKNVRVYPYTAADVLRFFEERGYGVHNLRGQRVTEDALDRQLVSCNDYVAIPRRQ